MTYSVVTDGLTCCCISYSVHVTLCRLKLRLYRIRACGTCAASSCIRAFRYACGLSRASQHSALLVKSHLG